MEKNKLYEMLELEFIMDSVEKATQNAANKP